MMNSIVYLIFNEQLKKGTMMEMCKKNIFKWLVGTEIVFLLKQHTGVGEHIIQLIHQKGDFNSILKCSLRRERNNKLKAKYRFWWNI